MALHENFIEYTQDEINKIKRDVCTRHNCPYMSFVANTNKSTATSNKCCNYILYTGQMRGCMPDECKHYLDNDVTKKRFGIPVNEDYIQ